MATKRKPTKKQALKAIEAARRKIHKEKMHALERLACMDREPLVDRDALLMGEQETLDDVPVEFDYARRPIGWKDVLAACLFSALLGFIIGVHL